MQNKISVQTLNTILKDIRQDAIQKIVVGGVILTDNDKPLLLKRASTDFMGDLVEIPSGTVHPQEDLLTALAREVYEETGLTVASIETYLGYFDYFSQSGKKTRQINFKITTTHLNIVLSEEHQNFFIYSVKSKEYKALHISEETQQIIENALSCTSASV